MTPPPSPFCGYLSILNSQIPWGFGRLGPSLDFVAPIPCEVSTVVQQVFVFGLRANVLLFEFGNILQAWPTLSNYEGSAKGKPMRVRLNSAENTF